jgi:hypothetical protein
MDGVSQKGSGDHRGFLLTYSRPPTDTTRNATKPATDRAKNHDSNALVDQTSRRPGAERHISRNSASKTCKQRF